MSSSTVESQTMSMNNKFMMLINVAIIGYLVYSYTQTQSTMTLIWLAIMLLWTGFNIWQGKHKILMT